MKGEPPVNPMTLISRSAAVRIESFADSHRTDASCVVAAVVEEWVHRVLDVHRSTAAEGGSVVERARHVSRRKP